jgi:uroporphyrinogen decarboxylase
MKKEMTGRERVVAAIEFNGPDRLPHKHSYLPAALKQFPDIVKLLREFPSDFAGEDNPEEYSNSISKLFKAGQWVDEWSCTWTVLRDGFSGQVTSHPLEDLKMLRNYSWPEAEYIDISGEINIAKKRGDRYVLLGWLTLFERMINLRGFENLMTDIAEGEPELVKIRNNILKFNLDMIDRLLELDPDGIFLADDWGSQLSLMVNPSVWRQLFLPAYKKMFERIREAGKHVFFHTDGYTIDILPDLVKAGANVFWADLTVNPLNALRDRLGGKVCFLGLTDVQFIMKWGTLADVENHGKDLVKSLGTYNGGFIASSEIGPDQPWESIKTILETFYRYGRYPIRID